MHRPAEQPILHRSPARLFHRSNSTIERCWGLPSALPGNRVTDSADDEPQLVLFARERRQRRQLQRQGVAQRPGPVERRADPAARLSQRLCGQFAGLLHLGPAQRGAGDQPVLRAAGASIRPNRTYRIDGNGVVQNATINANGAEPRRCINTTSARRTTSSGSPTMIRGGPVKATLGVFYSRAISNLQAAQADDIEHGLYTTSAGVATSPAAPGCNNGASTCATGPGSHGYEFGWHNGGTSGLPSVSYLAPYANILSNPADTTFKSNWAWSQLSRPRTRMVGEGRSAIQAYLHQRGLHPDGGLPHRPAGCRSDVWPLPDQWHARRRRGGGKCRRRGAAGRSLAVLSGPGLRDPEHPLFNQPSRTPGWSRRSTALRPPAASS